MVDRAAGTNNTISRLSSSVLASLQKRWNQEYDFVFNLASETKYDQPAMIYDEKVVEVAKAVIEEAKKHTGLKRIFDISTAQIYAHGSKPASEGGKVKPWTGIAEAKLKVEELWLQSGLPIVILRPAIVYGPGDQSGLSTFRTKLPLCLVGDLLREANWGAVSS